MNWEEHKQEWLEDMQLKDAVPPESVVDFFIRVALIVALGLVVYVGVK
jgi:hypothetical protein